MTSMAVFEFLKKLAHRLWSTNEILLLVRPAGKPLEESERKACPGEFRPITEENIGDCAAFEDAAHYVPIYRSMLAEGSYGHYGYLDGDCVYREWIQQRGAVTYEGCTVRLLTESEKYSHYVFCAPHARGKGFQAAGGYRLCSNYSDYTIYALVTPNNISSLKNFRRNGYKIQSRIRVKCRFLRRTLTETCLTSDKAKVFWMEEDSRQSGVSAPKM